MDISSSSMPSMATNMEVNPRMEGSVERKRSQEMATSRTSKEASSILLRDADEA
jgi:hypothetical protein